MSENLKNTLNGLLSTVYGIDENGVAELYESDGSDLKADALQIIIDRDAQRIAALKPDTKKYFDDGYKKGQSESLTKFEKEVASKYGLKSDKRGIELIEDIVAQYKQDNPDDPEKIKKSKIYLDAIEQLNREKEEAANNVKTEFDNYKKQVEREKVFGQVSQKALAIFENMKPVLPTDAVKANNIKQVIVRELEAMNYTIRDGQPVLLDDEGNDLLDSHGHRIKFENVVKSTAEKYVEFYAADGKAAPQHRNTNNGQQPVFKINSETEFIALSKEVKTPEERAALVTAYKEAKDAGRL